MTTTDHLVTRAEHSPANRAPVADFKVGDRVEFIENYGEKTKVGDRGVVMAIEATGLVTVDPDLGGQWVYVFDHRMKLVEEPASEPAEWTPGDGWREVPQAEALRAKVDTVCFDGLASKRYWMREEPAPTLPTTPFTVVQIDGDYGVDVWILLEDGWRGVRNGLGVAEGNERYITGFEVLAEPRNATVDRIADEMRERSGNQYDAAAAALVRLYGDRTVLP